MVRCTMAAAAICIASSACGQVVIDRSDDGVSDRRLKQTLEAVASKLRDPVSAQFRRLYSPKENVLCGEINGRNGYGGYAGFTPFHASLATGSADIMPRERDFTYKLRVEAYALIGCQVEK